MKITVAIRVAVAVAVLAASQASGRTAEKKIQTTKVQAKADSPTSVLSFDYGGGTDGPYEASVYLGGRNGRTLHIQGTQEDDLIKVQGVGVPGLPFTVSITDRNTGVDRLGNVGGFYYGDFDLVVIHGLAGNDRIENRYTWRPDMIYGGLGNDEILAGPLESYLSGQEGDDTIHGGQGNDIIFGGINEDVLVGEGGCDIIDGGPGDDRIGGGYRPENSSISSILGSDDETTDFVTGGSGTDRFYPAASDWVDFDPQADVDVLE